MLLRKLLLSGCALALSGIAQGGEAVDGRLAALAAAHPDLARVETLTTTLRGRPIPMLVIGAGDAPTEQRQGLLMASGLDGRRLVDGELLLAVAEELLGRDDLAGELDGRVIIMLPRVDRDGAQTLLGGLGPVRETAGNRRPDDTDRDGRVDEDGPTDLNDDGAITWMRVPDGEGEWVIDEHDPRAMRKKKEHERGTHKLMLEGLDDDGDGEFNEDGGDGVLIDRNFAHGFVEQQASSGAFPVSELESRALVDLLLRHPGLSSVLVLGADDTLVSLPSKAKKVRRGRFGGGFSAPLDGLLEADVTVMGEISEWLKDAGEPSAGADDGSGDPDVDADANGDGDENGADDEQSADDDDADGETRSASPVKAEGPADGSLLAWAYHQGGRWPLGVVAWKPPEKLPAPEKKEQQASAGEADGAAADADAADATDATDDATAHDDEHAGKGPRGKGRQTEEDDDDKPGSDPDSPVPAAVLAWLDADHGGQGIVPWSPYDHPEFGAVEIGGLAPGTLFNPPLEDVAPLAQTLAAFVLQVLDNGPVLGFEDVKLTDHDEGLVSVEAALVNTGALPTCPRFAADARLARPVRVRPVLPDHVQILNGPTQVLVDQLAGHGGRRELRWVLAGVQPGDVLKLAVDADCVPDFEQELTLR